MPVVFLWSLLRFPDVRQIIDATSLIKAIALLALRIVLTADFSQFLSSLGSYDRDGAPKLVGLFVKKKF